MTRSSAILILIALLASAIFASQALRWNAAHLRHDDAQRHLRTTAADAAELARLRATAETSIFGEPPAEDFIDRVNRTLAAVGLPPATAGNITREADRAVAPQNAGRRRRDMRLELRPISPPDLGRFLAAWNAENPAWAARQITLRRPGDRRASPEDYHVTLTLSAEYTQSAPTAGAVP